jgi:hypothetical protein
MPEKRLFTTSVTEKSATDLEGVGTLRWKNDYLYRWVKNSTGDDAVVGDLVTYQPTKGSSFYEEVIQPVTATLNHLAGVWTSAPEDGQYGWIMVKGYYASVQIWATDTTQAVGLIMVPQNAQDYGKSAANFLASVAQTVASNAAVSVQLPVAYVELLETVATTTAQTVAAGCKVNCIAV